MSNFTDSIKDTILGEQISNNIWTDNNGQLICENVVLARTGYYDYRESELIEGGSPEKIVRVFRSPEEVFDPTSMKSMNFKPLVDDHPDENVTPETVGELQKGFMTNIRRGTGEFDGCLMADIIATDPYVIDEILSKRKRDLSVGYTADIEEVDGQYFMKNIRGNHIALCEAGRAGNARIRDSKEWTSSEFVKHLTENKSKYVPLYKSGGADRVAEEVHETLLKEGWSGSTRNKLWTAIEQVFKGSIEDAVPVKVGGVVYRAGDYSVLSYADKPNTFIVVKNYNGENPYNGGGTVEFSLAGAKKTADDFVIMERLENKYGKHEGYRRWMAGKNDSAFEDFEAKGSFESLSALKSHYAGATVMNKGKDIVVALPSGVKLLYTYLNGDNSKVIFIRKMNDSINDSVEVLGDSHKLKVGQRAEYVGQPCMIEGIYPNRALQQFLVEFGFGGNVYGRHTYDEVVELINQGKIKLLDSVVFDCDTKQFKLESEDCDTSEDYADSFSDKYSDSFHDKAGALRPFRVSVGGKKFDTLATSFADAVCKVRAAVKDAIPNSINFAGKTIPKASGDYYWMKFGRNGVLQYHPKRNSGQVTTSHPYDETEYHWATSTDGRSWRIIYNGSTVGSMSGDAEAVLAELERRDKEKKLKRTGGIW